MASQTISHTPSATSNRLPEIPWAQNEGRLIWSLISEMERPENFKVLLGKKDNKENTSGDSKAKVCKRMAQALVPELFAMNPKTIGERIKAKMDWLVTTYKKHAKRLGKTGEGVQDSQNSSNSETLEFYIPGDGPDESTPEQALNIWNEIMGQFSYFEHLHRLYASRPNVVPICVTTGVTRRGPRTVWHQSPDDINIDPVLLALSSKQTTTPTPTPVSPSPSQRSFSTNISNTPSVTTPVPTRTPSMTKRSTPVVPQKRSFIESMLEMSRANFEHLRKEAQLKRVDGQQSQLFEEFKLGIWTADEYKIQVHKLTETDTAPSASRHQECHSSPEWDSELPSTVPSSQEL